MAGININSSSGQTPMQNQQVDKYISLCKEGKIIEAVKAYKDDTGCSVKEAKDYIDNLRAQQRRNVSTQRGQHISQPNQDKYLELCKKGLILQAVKEYKDDTDCSLMEAKKYVDNLCTQCGLSNSQSAQKNNHSTSSLNSHSYSRVQTEPSYVYQDSNSTQSVWESLPTWKKVLNYINMVLIPLIAIFVLVQMCKGPKTKPRKRPRHIPGTQFSMLQSRIFSDYMCPQWKYV